MWYLPTSRSAVESLARTHGARGRCRALGERWCRSLGRQQPPSFPEGHQLAALAGSVRSLPAFPTPVPCHELCSDARSGDGSAPRGPWRGRGKRRRSPRQPGASLSGAGGVWGWGGGGGRGGEQPLQVPPPLPPLPVKLRFHHGSSSSSPAGTGDVSVLRRVPACGAEPQRPFPGSCFHLSWCHPPSPRGPAAPRCHPAAGRWLRRGARRGRWRARPCASPWSTGRVGGQLTSPRGRHTRPGLGPAARGGAGQAVPRAAAAPDPAHGTGGARSPV